MSRNDVLSVAYTCKHLFPIARECLYRHNISEDGSDVLFWAIKKKRLSTAKIALDFGADVNAVIHPGDGKDKSPLSTVIKYLLERIELPNFEYLGHSRKKVKSNPVG